MQDVDNISNEDIVKSLNIPPRDEGLYPMPSEDEQKRGGNFMLKLSLLASSVDENLKALVWKFYADLDTFILGEENPPPDKPLELAITLEKLRSYVRNSNNPALPKHEGL